MSSLNRPRGPLPPRVYWTRRLSVLGIALVLVFGLGRVLGSYSDGSSEPGVARQAAALPSVTGSPSTTRVPGEKKRTKKRQQATAAPTPTAPVLAPPSGPCATSDIVVTPQIFKEEGGGPVLISLELTTRVTEACTWTVSPDTLTLKISSGSDDIWSSRQCPTSVPTEEVVVRQDLGTTVGVRWNGKRSDATCSALTEWALPGYYHVVAAALAGEPTDVQFKLTRVATTVITTTITPSPKAGGGKNKPSDPDASQPTDEPTGTPTGATEPR
ncbi:MAG: hypothetical protein ABIQ15_12375 [Nocardioides sp.]